MYLDEKGYCTWSNFCDWKPADALLFVQRFPEAAGIGTARTFVQLKIQHLADTISGKRYTTIGGVRCDYPDARREDDVAEIGIWREVAAALGVVAP